MAPHIRKQRNSVLVLVSSSATCTCLTYSRVRRRFDCFLLPSFFHTLDANLAMSTMRCSLVHLLYLLPTPAGSPTHTHTHTHIYMGTELRSLWTGSEETEMVATRQPTRFAVQLREKKTKSKQIPRARKKRYQHNQFSSVHRLSA